MSLFSKIGKGIKKLTLKKVLKVAAPVAALAIPGVGGAVLAAASVAGRVVRRSATSAGKIVTGVASEAGGTIRDVAGAAADTALGLGKTARDTLDTVSSARDTIEGQGADAAARWNIFQSGGLSGALNGLTKSLPTIVMVGVAAIVLIAIINRRK
jgi:hypothetical protein